MLELSTGPSLLGEVGTFASSNASRYFTLSLMSAPPITQISARRGASFESTKCALYVSFLRLAPQFYSLLSRLYCTQYLFKVVLQYRPRNPADNVAYFRSRNLINDTSHHCGSSLQQSDSQSFVFQSTEHQSTSLIIRSSVSLVRFQDRTIASIRSISCKQSYGVYAATEVSQNRNFESRKTIMYV